MGRVWVEMKRDGGERFPCSSSCRHLFGRCKTSKISFHELSRGCRNSFSQNVRNGRGIRVVCDEGPTTSVSGEARLLTFFQPASAVICLRPDPVRTTTLAACLLAAEGPCAHPLPWARGEPNSVLLVTKVLGTEGCNPCQGPNGLVVSKRMPCLCLILFTPLHAFLSACGVTCVAQWLYTLLLSQANLTS